MYRSSHQWCSIEIGVLKTFTKFTGKHLCQSLFFNKAAGLRPATLLKKRLWHRCFPVNFVKFLRTRFLQNTSGRLLLYVTLLTFKLVFSIFYFIVSPLHYTSSLFPGLAYCYTSTRGCFSKNLEVE